VVRVVGRERNTVVRGERHGGEERETRGVEQW
jgi:hypothetical protein